MDPRTGGIEALDGLAYDAPQPPGSTMKIITATAALQAGLVKLTTEFPEAVGRDDRRLHAAERGRRGVRRER